MGRTHLVELADDLVEHFETLESVFGDGALTVEVPEVGDRREHDADAAVRLVVQVLKRTTKIVSHFGKNSTMGQNSGRARLDPALF